jgi:hypothetical protein
LTFKVNCMNAFPLIRQRGLCASRGARKGACVPDR